MATLGTTTHLRIEMELLLDRAQLLESLAAMGEDPQDALSMLLELYLEDAPQLVKEIVQASALPDLDALRFAAHSLKSSSATLGAQRLAHLCRQLEAKARSGDRTHLLTLGQQLEATYQETLQALRDPTLL